MPVTGMEPIHPLDAGRFSAGPRLQHGLRGI